MEFGWLFSDNRKVHQRRMNKLMRLVNKNIENDDLWRGRFVITQTGSQWYSYGDCSGHELYVVLKLTDRLTGQTHEIADTVNHWAFINGHHLWRAMNDFIVEEGYCDVWRQDPRPGSSEYKELTNQMVKKGWKY